MYLSRKNFNLLLFGRKPLHMMVGRFMFVDWEMSDKKKNKFGNSVMCFLEENQYLRSHGIINFHNPQAESKNGTTKGDIIEITFYTNIINSENIIEYLMTEKIRMHCAEPFEKPFKTLRQVIQENIFSGFI